MERKANRRKSQDLSQFIVLVYTGIIDVTE
jgi:hypothetical protein